MDFFFSTRRISLLEMNHRFRRIVLRTPLFTTFLRKRFNSISCDSFGRNTTVVIISHLPSRWDGDKKNGCRSRGQPGNDLMGHFDLI
jgi:hypothetical protein